MHPHQLAAIAGHLSTPDAPGHGPGLHLTGPLVVTLLVVTIGYILAVACWPYVRCRRCTGTGRLRSPLGHAHRLCPRCTGSGRRLRPGRRVWNHYRRLKDSL